MAIEWVRIGECEFCGSTRRLIQIRVYKEKYFCCLDCQGEMVELMLKEYSWKYINKEIGK